MPSPLTRPGVAVFVGGALGSVLRAGIGAFWPAAPGGLPGATLTVNLVGAFGLGVLVALVPRRMSDAAGRQLLLFAGTGVCGGFTTYSAFMVETIRLAGAGWGSALLYLVASVAGGVAAAWLGVRLGLAGSPPAEAS